MKDAYFAVSRASPVAASGRSAVPRELSRTHAAADGEATPLPPPPVRLSQAISKEGSNLGPPAHTYPHPTERAQETLGGRGKEEVKRPSDQKKY